MVFTRNYGSRRDALVEEEVWEEDNDRNGDLILEGEPGPCGGNEYQLAGG